MTSQHSAPAKVILLGEHAVVYGLPAIALPLSHVRAYADYQISESPLKVWADTRPDPLVQWTHITSCASNPLAAMIRLTAEHCAVSDLKGDIVIRSDIPVASGLGSGAAVSAALGRAVAAIAGQRISDCDLNALVYEVEKLHHGTPSGIDNTVVVYEKPVYFVKGKPIQSLDVSSPIHLVVADTGVAASTRDAVAHVRAQLEAQPPPTQDLLDGIGALVRQAHPLLKSGPIERIGSLMTRNHELLQTLGVSSRALDDLVAASIAAGAYGAKLSGGGRGGNIIALTNERRRPSVEAELIRAGAKRVLSSTLLPKAIRA